MTSVNLDRHVPTARSLARVKAKAATGQCGLTADDREDIESQLLLVLCLRLAKFDSKRSSLNTFTSRVMDKEVASIQRYRLAQRRLHLGRPELVDGGALDELFVASPATVERQEFWLDVGRVATTLPAVLRETVLALRCGSPTEASRTLGTVKSVVYERIAQIPFGAQGSGLDGTRTRCVVYIPHMSEWRLCSGSAIRGTGHFSRENSNLSQCSGERSAGIRITQQVEGKRGGPTFPTA